MQLSKKLFIFCILISFFIPQGIAKSYYYNYINLELNFSPDGSVVVSQERAYNFEGSFTYAYIDLLKKDASDITFIEIRDLDTNIRLVPDIENDAHHAKATWHYSANNQIKRFLIVYKIEGAVKRYQDVSDFYWKVIEDSHESILALNAEINLPSSSPDLFKVFVHSSANPGTLNFSSDSRKAYVTMGNIPVNTFVEFRILTEPAVFSSAVQIQSKNYENILNEEKSNLFYSSLFGSFKSVWVLAILIIIGILIFLYFYLKYGREPKIDYDITYEHEPPRYVPPMTLVGLLGGEEQDVALTMEAKGVIATIFDLARRDYLEIREVKKKAFFGLTEKTEQIFTLTEKGKKEKDSLLDFEADVLEFIMKCGSKGDEVTSSEITNYCKKPFSHAKEDISEMNKKARNWFESNVFPITEKLSREKRGLFTIIFIIYFAVLVIYMLLISGFNPIFILLAILGVVLVHFAGISISKRTPESALEKNRWQAFKRFISDFSAMEDAPPTLLKIWDEYLIYAIVLGVAARLLENLKQLSIQRNQPISPVLWYRGPTGAPMKSMNVQTMSGFISNLSNTVNALSSSTSIGGGFSGGGGGGGGGGGSGAG